MISQKDLDKAILLKECPNEIAETIHLILKDSLDVFNTKESSNLEWTFYFNDAEEGCVGSYYSFNKKINYILEFFPRNLGVNYTYEKNSFNMFIIYNKRKYNLCNEMPEEFLLKVPTKKDLYDYKQAYIDNYNQEQIIKQQKKQKIKNKALEDEKFIVSLIESLSNNQIKFLSSLSKVKVAKIQKIAKEKIKRLK